MGNFPQFDEDVYQSVSRYANLILLLPGNYKIEVLHPSFFTEYQLPKTKTINFEVVE